MDPDSYVDQLALAPVAESGRISAYAELGKPGLTALVLVTTAVGFTLAGGGGPDAARLWWTLVGTGLAAWGANALNEWWERERDARMERTRRRPLPARRLSDRQALRFGLATVVAGPVLLCVSVSGLAGFLALLSATVYLLIYTPLKTRSSFCTLVGAVSGAMPPMIGWAAAAGRLGPGAWMLAAVLFAWQVPHFLALAWLHRDDYARAGFRLLPLFDPGGRVTGQVVVLYCLALLALGPILTLGGLGGWVQALGSVVLGTMLLASGVALYARRTPASARRLFLASLVYLPGLLGLLVLDGW